MNDVWMLIGGVEMNGLWILAIGTGLLLSFLGGRWWAEKRDRWREHAARLEEVVRSADLINSNSFHSLEVVQKRLESLLARADWAEQKLRCLLTQAEVGRVDQYATAALLLSEGEEAEQVARTLRLPLAQVRLVKELRQEVEKEKSAIPRSRREKDSQPRERARRENGAAPREKVAVGQNGASRLGGG